MKVDIIDGPLDAGAPAKPRYRTVRSGEKTMKVRIVDADSPTFAADFGAAFSENVRRARRNNRALAVAAE
jgi:hypothetical protein